MAVKMLLMFNKVTYTKDSLNWNNDLIFDARRDVTGYRMRAYNLQVITKT